MNNKEIELKFIINEEIKTQIIADLEQKTSKISEKSLIDTYYVPYYRDFEINGETMECVRIREDDKGSVLAYKKIHREANPVYCDEYETKVENKNEMEKILFALGFEVQMVIDKTRISYYLGNLEFDFDSVKGLGELLEVELKNSDDVSVIYDYVSKYGLVEKDVTYKGIQVLMKEAYKKETN
ncbi:MAG: class IV adenylate cyclase [Clostridia bacterium]|nr:class IV adenylate cyclase [Clostridia bacterium]